MLSQRNFHFNLILFITINYFAIFVKAALFAFLCDNESVFTDCENEPNYLGVADIFDLSDLKVELYDDRVHLEGSVTMLWDADPNDRVEFQTEVMKYERGSWQPTLYTLIQKDFCRTLFDKNDIWYKAWSQYIENDNPKCINNKGYVYHHTPFDLETVVDIKGEDRSGRHKVVIKIHSYNQMNVKQPNSVCLEILGDIVKK